MSVTQSKFIKHSYSSLKVISSTLGPTKIRLKRLIPGQAVRTAGRKRRKKANQVRNWGTTIVSIIAPFAPHRIHGAHLRTLPVGEGTIMH